MRRKQITYFRFPLKLLMSPLSEQPNNNHILSSTAPSGELSQSRLFLSAYSP